MDQDRLCSISTPSSVAAIISSSVCGPGSRPTLVIRTIGSRANPSARTEPAWSRPATAAESRPARTPTQTPLRTASRAVAGVPSSSKPKEPNAPGIVGSMVMFISSEPKRSEPSWSRSSHEVPANAASQPRMRSSSIACPTDSWICSDICSPPSSSVVSPLGQDGALSSSWHSAAIRSAWPGRSISRTSSQPRVPNWPRKAG